MSANSVPRLCLGFFLNKRNFELCKYFFTLFFNGSSMDRVGTHNHRQQTTAQLLVNFSQNQQKSPIPTFETRQGLLNSNFSYGFSRHFTIIMMILLMDEPLQCNLCVWNPSDIDNLGVRCNGKEPATSCPCTR